VKFTMNSEKTRIPDPGKKVVKFFFMCAKENSIIRRIRLIGGRTDFHTKSLF
jgi:hypothetical protein